MCFIKPYRSYKLVLCVLNTAFEQKDLINFLSCKPRSADYVYNNMLQNQYFSREVAYFRARINFVFKSPYLVIDANLQSILILTKSAWLICQNKTKLFFNLQHYHVHVSKKLFSLYIILQYMVPTWNRMTIPARDNLGWDNSTPYRA